MSKVVLQLNVIQADANALYIKFHDLHWNVFNFLAFMNTQKRLTKI